MLFKMLIEPLQRIKAFRCEANAAFQSARLYYWVDCPNIPCKTKVFFHGRRKVVVCSKFVREGGVTNRTDVCHYSQCLECL